MTGKRDRYLRKQRERVAKSDEPKSTAASAPGTPPAADMRFECSTCGTQFTVPGGIILGPLSVTDASGGLHLLPTESSGWQRPCPICHQPAKAVNEVTVERGGLSVHGFADTPEQATALFRALDELRALQDDTDFEQILEVLEAQQSPALRPVVEYLRENHLALVGLGVNLLLVVVALLTWLAPRQPGEQPQPPPAGITHEQMDRLLRDFESSMQQQTGDHQAGHSQHDPQGPEQGVGRPPGAEPNQ